MKKCVLIRKVHLTTSVYGVQSQYYSHLVGKDAQTIKYRLYHEVEVSLRFTHRGPEAQGCVNRKETNTE